MCEQSPIVESTTWHVARRQRTLPATDFRPPEGRGPADKRRRRGDDDSGGREVPLPKRLHRQEHGVRTHRSLRQKTQKENGLGPADEAYTFPLGCMKSNQRSLPSYNFSSSVSSIYDM